MKPSNWLYLLSILVAVVSVFLSNYLGRKTSENEFKRKQLETRYFDFYVPILRHMYTFNPVIFKRGGFAGNMPFMKIIDEPVPEDLQDSVGKTQKRRLNWTTEYIKENIQYATPTLLEIYYKQFQLRYKSPEYDHSLKRGTSEFSNALEAFEALEFRYNKKLILQVLEEAQTISLKLQLPNISKPLLDVLK